jgi:release factor glutamine methyltransferase
VTDPRQVLRDATERLLRAGVDSPRVDAELLLSHVLGVPRSRLLTISGVHPSAVVALDRLLKRRAAREPLQHLVGRAPFRHVEVAVGPGVFVPRPETELLVDAVRPALAAGDAAVDLCSGSGALALALADEVPGLVVAAVECERDALAWLRRNAARTAVRVVDADVTAGPLLPELAGTVAAVVCNPPYVPTSVEVGAEVRHDPAGAVFAGSDGLALMPAVIARAAELLRAGGVLALEHDDTHETAVPALLAADGRWTDVQDHRDLTGRPRYATARRA